MDNMMAQLQGIPLQHYLIFCSTIFAIGVIGVLTRRNVIIIMMSIELMLNSVNLLLAAFSAYRGDPAGQVFVFFIMALAAAEVAIGLAIVIMVYRNTKSIDIESFTKLRL
ncbi:NADH-quinone oxidoreductase subunit NuoK [Sphingobacterium corticis]|uniref:NADH-quinone oxidoreductase subunit K n=1 Tax=Sphingobacterium corticis TaxID=1812823 RepID=A0ABW5NGX3_9SPHI